MMCDSLINFGIFYRGFLFFFLLLSTSLFAWEITSKEAEDIGNRIFFNECSSSPEKLVWWNDRENFASLGIGHFIWFPKGAKSPFEETFPLFLSFLKARGISLPHWLNETSTCPWQSKQEFLKNSRGTRKKDLQTLLTSTIPLQATFIIQQFEKTIPKLFSDLPIEQQQTLFKKIEEIAKTAQGKYALIDYHNFKGGGLSLSERYGNYGWGLRQVLEEMPELSKDPLVAFSETAKRVIKRRVKNAPPERHEERWLPGWLKRIDSYIPVPPQ